MIISFFRFLFCFLGWNFLFFLFFSLYLNVTAFAKLSHPQWQKLTTPHFEVLFDKEQKDIALEYAIEAEVVHEILSPYFSERPSKTILHIDSETDIENALATLVPRHLMSVTPRWPSPFLLHYGSWKYLVLMHEYTHILQMSPNGSWLWRLLEPLAGNASHPNIYLPGWYVEGMGVVMESHFSDFGRLNSPFFYSNIRTMVDEGTWGREDISQINERSIPTWPFGRRRYFYGSILMNEISSQEGIDKMSTLNSEQARHGSRLFLNKTPRRLFEKSYQEIFQTTYDRWQFQSEKDLKKLTESPVKKSQTLPLFNTSENITERHSPQMSPNGKHLLFIQGSIEKGHHIVLLTRQTLNESFLHSKGRVVAFGANIQSVSWINNEEFVFDRLKNTRRDSVFRFYNDLYRGHISGRRPQRMTIAKRLQFPSLNWNRTHILAIQSIGDQNLLVQIHPKTKDITVLYTPTDPARLSYPLAFTENEIAFIAQDAYGQRKLKAWNKKTQQVRSLPLDQEDILFLSKINGGLLYNSAASGVPNLYFWDEENQKSYPITHSKTAIRNGTFDHFHKELWMSQFHADGYRMEVQKSSLEPTNLPYIKIPHASEKKPLKSTSEQVEASLCSSHDRFIFDSEPLMCLNRSEDSQLENIKSRDMRYVGQLREKWQTHFQNSPPSVKKYHGISYLFPYVRFPYYYYSKDTGSRISFYVRGADPLEHHNYKLHLHYKPRLKAIDGVFRYDHYKLWSFEIQDDKKYMKPFRGSDDSEDKNKDTERMTYIFLRKGFFLNDYWTTYLGWSFRRDFYSINQEALYQHGPEVILDYSNTQPDSILATSENFYVTRFFKINKPSYSQVTLGTHLIWSFASPLKFLTRDKQPVSQNSSLRYHSLSLRTDHTFTSSKNMLISVYGPLGLRPMSNYIRGYPQDTFSGWQIHSLNLEYTFPLFEIQKGLGTGPLFFKGVDITLLSDHLLLKGQYFDTQNNRQSTNANRLFSSIGIDAKLNITLGYSLPLFLGVGLYYGFDRDVSEGLQFAFSIGSQANF